MNEMKELTMSRVSGYTLVGYSYADKTFPMPGGNCFSVIANDNKEYRVVNFNHENMAELERRGIKDVKLFEIGKHVAVINDERIGNNWYREDFCEVCCPEALLPMPQQLRLKRKDMRGERVKHDGWTTYSKGKAVEYE